MLKSEEVEVSIKEPHSICLPERILRPFLKGGHSRVRVRVHHEGKSLEFYAALRQWQGIWQITFSKKNQKELGVFPNDYFRLQLFGGPEPIWGGYAGGTRSGIGKRPGGARHF